MQHAIPRNLQTVKNVAVLMRHQSSAIRIPQASKISKALTTCYVLEIKRHSGSYSTSRLDGSITSCRLGSIPKKEILLRLMREEA